MLPEDTLLEIFDIHRRDTMVWSRDGHRWDWLRLAHVCRRWRDVISISPHRLDLWILCKSGGVPIERILGSSSWSSVPLIVRFKASPRNDELILLPDNIAAALRHWDRICEIDLDVTRALAGSIVEVIHESPLQALKSLRVTVENATEPPLLIRNSLLGGSAPHLREIKLDGIAFPFPAVRQVLSSANNLVELHLSNIPNEVYFSPDDLITTLSALVHLKSLTIGFHSPASRPPSITHRPPTSKRTITLSALTHLDFHGASEYLEEFVAQIDDSPSLRQNIHQTLQPDPIRNSPILSVRFPPQSAGTRRIPFYLDIRNALGRVGQRHVRPGGQTLKRELLPGDVVPKTRLAIILRDADRLPALSFHPLQRAVTQHQEDSKQKKISPQQLGNGNAIRRPPGPGGLGRRRRRRRRRRRFGTVVGAFPAV
jgi:hypothetical protein